MDGAPRHVVEAQSYGPLITLAANPPRYPRNPCKAPLKPLVLYIVRVPGSRDVFLSPLKPPTECSISPALIEAALYYIHVSTPEDEAVLSAIEKEKCLKETPLEANRPPFPVAPSVRLQRKPVPRGEVKPPSIPRRPVSSDTSISFQTGAGNECRHSQGPGAVGTPPDGFPDAQRIPTVTRRPIPPIPLDPAKHLFPESALNSTDPRTGNGQPRGGAQPMNSFGKGEYLTFPSAPASQGGPQGRASWDGGRSSILHEQDPHRNVGSSPLNPEQSSRDRRSSPNFFQHGRRRPSEKSRKPPSPFHLTLIRRDTTHNIQWNVGGITNCTSQSSHEVALDGTITIEIHTLGYKKLAAEKLRFSAESPTTPHRDSTNACAGDSQTFIRHLTLTNPQSHGRHHSNSSINSLPSPDQILTPKESLPSSKPQRGRYYTFKSPWDGTCTFITGINGRSLKCKHTIPITAKNSFAGLNLQDLVSGANKNSNNNNNNNPNADMSQPHLNLQKLQSALEASAAAPLPSPPSPPASASASASPPGSTATAAELRFNLPIFTAPHRSHQHEKNGAHAPSGGAGNNNNTHSDNSHTHPTRARLRSQVEELASRLDLSLARERAGGGAFGKSAKLGKLIIEDEGLKMLDLVVAACMGVWWGVYDNLS
ncbi:conserved hypothetical protein [Histoplasma capsulatum G186AR]|uniref:Uncharacterized protein n=1 Tax=Ajellomyces capsulatus (strain G186AR / H82 / ATCC MYA-2454 / RMSCC 2432) TaxID=447093 RepID=C0NH05_AJECG|nr:uncharacterized protein HCBG_02627 [Histoplasma capsulatum G186AR]EEH09090.1 conserved hypothetical protein [Histoplasma capsulatum G186AR]